MSFTYAYPRPAVTCDVVAFAMQHDDLAVLLIRRKEDPFRGGWALPGGFVNENEPLVRAAARELHEETGVKAKLEQVAAFGDPGRDPRGHTITIAWLTFLLAETVITASDDAEEAAFVPLRSLGLRGVPASRSLETRSERNAKRAPGDKIRLAFDHGEIIKAAYRKLVHHIDHPLRPVAFEITPARFTLAELRRTYEIILGRAISLPKIRKHLVDRGFVVPSSSKASGNIKGQLYKWNRR